MTTAAIYLRQSLDVPEGIERQRSRCLSLLAARGWDLAKDYADNDTSATKARGEGTQWAAMLADAKAGRFEVVVGVDVDRLLRTLPDLVALMDTGAKVLTVDGEVDLTTADGEFRATMLAGIARFETRRKSERQRRANEARALAGRRTSGRRPFGYEQDGMTVRPAEARAVRDAYAAVLSGVSLAEISRTWNAAGFNGQARYKGERRGEPSPWRADSVRHVLLNPRYQGKRAHNGEIVADAAWPALVDDTTWLAVEATLRDPARRSGQPGGRYLLSGLAMCGVCGATVHGGSSSRPGVRTYRCSASTGHVARKAAPAEEFVGDAMVARLSQPDVLALFRTHEAPDVDGLRQEAVALRSRLEALAIDFADGALTGQQLRTATARLRARLSEVDDQLAAAGRVDILGPLAASDDVRGAWDALTTSRQRTIIAALARVTLLPPGRGVRTFRPETVVIDWG